MKYHNTYLKPVACMVIGLFFILVFVITIVKTLNKNAPVNNSLTAVIINNDSIKINELNYYIVSAMSDINTISQQQFDADDWNLPYKDDMTLYEYIIKVSTDQLIQDNVLYQEAVAQGLQLTTDELKTTNEDAVSAYDGLAEHVKHNYSITQSLVNRIYQKKTLADRYLASVIKETGNHESNSTTEDARASAFNEVYEKLLEQYSITPVTDNINTITIGN